MFDNLTNRLTGAFSSLRGRRLTEDNLTEVVGEVRDALLEADVALEVAIKFVEAVKQKSVGREFVAAVRPGDMFIKFVHEELVNLMGTESSGFDLSSEKRPATILMAGLQGTGKTTTAVKLGHYLRTRESLNVATVSADVYRPAAIEQLSVLSQTAGIDFIEASTDESPKEIVKRAQKEANQRGSDVLIVDTAGRLAIDDDMMEEISSLHKQLDPVETLFVVDAMTGQDAAKTARSFNKVLPLTGVVLTKADGDARGGAALSVRALTQKPIKFLGTGEDIEALELFHPDRMASRILGMGDVLSLVEEAEQKVDTEKAQKMVRKLLRGSSFNFNDMLDQINQLEDMGGMAKMLDRLPSMPNANLGKLDGESFAKHLVVINSMTSRERVFPNLVNVPSRKKRIAQGSGTTLKDVNGTIRQFKQMQKQLKRMGNLRKKAKVLEQMMDAEN